jgi:crossover junction endodeoxyribonuclease RusA
MISEYAKGFPKAQPRVKSYSRGGKAGVYTPETKALREWRRAVEEVMERHKDKKLDGAFSVHLEFYMPRPKSHFRTGKFSHLIKDDAPIDHLTKPDLDNMIKLVLDVMTKSGYWKDDSQVIELSSSKNYADVMDAGCRIITKVL